MKKVLYFLLAFIVFDLLIMTRPWRALADEPCLGWECQEVKCPDGYAVHIPGKGYLPCEKFDRYMEGENEDLLAN